jgi:hypothetical protein
METKPETTEALTALRHITLAEVEQRIADVDAEKAALSLLRRSLAARERVRRRSIITEARHDQ